MADEVAVLAGGCFWCTEAVYLDVEGVKSVTSGYTGGRTSSPTYKQVCAGDTGHAEAVNEEHGGKVVTTIEPAATWYSAEDYHQDYFAREGERNPYCQAVIAPKLQKFRKSYQARLKSAGAGAS